MGEITNILVYTYFNWNIITGDNYTSNEVDVNYKSFYQEIKERYF